MLLIDFLLFGICTVLLIGQGFSLFLINRQKHALADTKANLRKLQDDLSALTGAARGAGDHVVGLEQKVRRLIERQDQQELRLGNERSYNGAIELVQQGASVEKIMSHCGLTRGEADLIVMLHGGLAKAG